MANIVKSADKLIGKTPLLELDNFAKAYDVPATILGKLEYLNPTGSVKDRAALYMINDAEKAGRLKPGGTIIEPTSGNTGIGIASVGAARGYKVIIVMPETMTKERRDMISAYGADIVLTDGKSGMSGAVAKAKAMVNEIEGSIILSQFENPSNAQAHYETTGPEIWDDTDGKVDIFIAGVGTGGTVTGVGKYLKEKNPNVKIVAVEPQTSPVLSGGKRLRRDPPRFQRSFLRGGEKDRYHAGRNARHLLGRGTLGSCRAGQASRKQGQDHRGSSPRLRRQILKRTFCLILY